MLLSASLNGDEEELRCTLTGPVATEHMDTLYELPFHLPSLSRVLYVLYLSLPPAAAAPYVLHVVTVQRIGCSGLQVDMT